MCFILYIIKYSKEGFTFFMEYLKIKNPYSAALSCHCTRNLMTNRWWSTVRVSHRSVNSVCWEAGVQCHASIKGQKSGWGSQEKGEIGEEDNASRGTWNLRNEIISPELVSLMH